MEILTRAMLSLFTLSLFIPFSSAQSVAELDAGKREFEARCGGCHGGDGKGGVRAPNVVNPGLVPERTEAEVRTLITEGLPEFGMPGFNVPEEQLRPLVAYYLSLTAPAFKTSVSGDIAAGRALFFGKGGCASCHSRGAETKVIGPDLSSLGASRTLGEIEEAVLDPDKTIVQGYDRVVVKLRDGSEVKGFARNESGFDVQLQTFDGRFRFLEAADIESMSRPEGSLMGRPSLNDSEIADLVAYLSRLDGTARSVESQDLPGSLSFAEIVSPNEGDWPTYNGVLGGNRHSELKQINTENVAKLAPAWIFPVETPRSMEMTPIVVDGVMYVTTSNTLYALDARSGRSIWTYSRPRTPGVMGDAGSGANRGVAVLGDRVFMVTDHAHMFAVDRLTGRLLWDTEMADYREHYGGTLAPLVVKDLVIGGVGGGDEGIRGFLAAYKVDTGEEAWRFWTVPLPGEPLSETWQGNVLPHGCGGTWLTGTYDPELDLLYWPIGNPCPDMNGDNRGGDNLYTDSMLALRPGTGELVWHYQYTPHDEFDWDANQTPVLADLEWQGSERKLLLHANRNGFFYVLDRTNGELLRAKAFIEKLDWATGIGDDGRPILAPNKRPTPAGNIVCPGLAGATNWMSPAYEPNEGLYIVQASEYCQIFTKREEPWQRGKQYFGGTAKNVPGEPSRKYLRAIDVSTGEIRWSVEQLGSFPNGGDWGGVLTTEGGLAFYGDRSGAFAAVRSADGKRLWQRHLNAPWHASPMTYSVDGKQFITIAGGSNVIAFALQE